MATLGRVKEVERFVACLSAQTNRNFELIVVDQNPDDRLLPVLAKVVAHGVALQHIRQAEPNQCLARNTGLENATMDVVAFPDDDCWYEPDTLALVLARMAALDAPAGLVIRWCEQDPIGQPAHSLDYAQWRVFRGADASMIAQFYRRDLFESIGGFDPSFGLHSWFGGAEETDLMFRILESGAAVVYTPDALVHHAYYAGPSADPWRAVCKRARSRSRGTGALYAKHRLSAYVILRGFSAPLVRPLLQGKGFKGIAQGLSTVLGRIEGFSRWIWLKK